MGSTGTGGRQTTHSCNQKIRLEPDFLIASIKLIYKTIYKANLKIKYTRDVGQGNQQANPQRRSTKQPQSKGGG